MGRKARAVRWLGERRPERRQAAIGGRTRRRCAAGCGLRATTGDERAGGRAGGSHLLRVVEAVGECERVEAAVEGLGQVGEEVGRLGDHGGGARREAAHVEAAAKLEELARLLGRGPLLVERRRVDAQHVARIDGVVYEALGQRLRPRRAELGGEVGHLVRRRLQLHRLEQRRLTRTRGRQRRGQAQARCAVARAWHRARWARGGRAVHRQTRRGR